MLHKIMLVMFMLGMLFVDRMLMQSVLTSPMTERSADATYGYVPENPILVGGGPAGERQFLRALRGPQGQPIVFERIGSCCPAKGRGLLYIYDVSYEGSGKVVSLYLYMYEYHEPKAPWGLLQ